MKIVISKWYLDPAYPVEHMNVLVLRANDSDEYLNTIPAGCSREQKLVVKIAFMRKLRTRYPYIINLYLAKIKDQYDDNPFGLQDTSKPS